MTPLEIAAKAWWDFEVEQSDCSKWDDLTDDYKKERIRFMRAALLALAECDLPVGDEGLQVDIPMFGKTPIDHASLRTFQAILRAIANEDTTPDDQ